MNMPSKTIAVALMAAAAPWLLSPAAALPISSPLALQSAVPSPFEAVGYRGRGYVGAGIGLAAGAIIGGAILSATQPRYGYGGYGYGGYDNGYQAYGYDQGYAAGYEPEYVEAPTLRLRARLRTWLRTRARLPSGRSRRRRRCWLLPAALPLLRPGFRHLSRLRRPAPSVLMAGV